MSQLKKIELFTLQTIDCLLPSFLVTTMLSPDTFKKIISSLKEEELQDSTSVSTGEDNLSGTQTASVNKQEQDCEYSLSTTEDDPITLSRYSTFFVEAKRSQHKYQEQIPLSQHTTNARSSSQTSRSSLSKVLSGVIRQLETEIEITDDVMENFENNLTC